MTAAQRLRFLELHTQACAEWESTPLSERGRYDFSSFHAAERALMAFVDEMIEEKERETRQQMDKESAK